MFADFSSLKESDSFAAVHKPGENKTDLATSVKQLYNKRLSQRAPAHTKTDSTLSMCHGF